MKRDNSMYFFCVGIKRAAGPIVNMYQTPSIGIFQSMASMPDIFECLARNIAPGLCGLTVVKKAIVCMLFGGSLKKSHGMFLRNNINVLMIGDAGVGKSQLLLDIKKHASVCVSTSGSGSSAAGLTASVIRDPMTSAYKIAPGAMVLAHGGVLCVDEFDKMKSADRVAMHEAMEQGTVSINKAGINTTLNASASVLAAANSVFGKWDDSKGDENIQLGAALMSRFDFVFILKQETTDLDIARHVLNTHAKYNNDSLNLPFAEYIKYCRDTCAPRLTVDAGKKICFEYTRLRSESTNGLLSYSVRHLESLIRISESIAKLRLKLFVDEDDVQQAVMLFKLSSGDANYRMSNISKSNDVDDDVTSQVVSQLRSRFLIGTQVNEDVIIADFQKRHYDIKFIKRAIRNLISCGQVVRGRLGNLSRIS